MKERKRENGEKKYSQTTKERKRVNGERKIQLDGESKKKSEW